MRAIRQLTIPLSSHADSVLGVILSNIEPLSGDIPRFGTFRGMAQRAEQVGFESVWLADHLLHRVPGEEDRGLWEAFTSLYRIAVSGIPSHHTGVSRRGQEEEESPGPDR